MMFYQQDNKTNFWYATIDFALLGALTLWNWLTISKSTTDNIQKGSLP